MRDPSQVDGFVRHAERLVAVDIKQEANIVMEMSRVPAVGGNPVDVHIKDPVGDWSDAFNAGFLAGLAERDIQYVRIAVGVTAKLKPKSDFPMMGQQDMRAGRIDDPSRTGDVSFLERSFKAIRVRLHKREDSPASFLLDVVARFMCSELFE